MRKKHIARKTIEAIEAADAEVTNIRCNRHIVLDFKRRDGTCYSARRGSSSSDRASLLV